MDRETLAALSRWPDVPACYGWLALDARGQWRLGEGGGEIVHHAGLMAYLSRNYAATERGEWFVQNGPQRVYVALARAPYIVRLDGDGAWQTHTGLAVRRITRALVDADGNAYLVCEHGLAGIDDRDLARVLATSEADDAAARAATLVLDNCRLSLDQVDAGMLPLQFGFIPRPCAPPAN